MMERNFDFKIRDKLKKLKRKEYKNLGSHIMDAKLTSENGEPVTAGMIIDMITYISRGDEDLAIRAFRASKDLIDICYTTLWALDYNVRMSFSYKLVYEILRLGFVTTKCVLDWNYHPQPQLPTFRVLEQVDAQINHMNNQVNLSPLVKRDQINQIIVSFAERSLVLNQVWKNAMEEHQEKLKSLELH